MEKIANCNLKRFGQAVAVVKYVGRIEKNGTIVEPNRLYTSGLNFVKRNQWLVIRAILEISRNTEGLCKRLMEGFKVGETYREWLKFFKAQEEYYQTYKGYLDELTNEEKDSSWGALRRAFKKTGYQEEFDFAAVGPMPSRTSFQDADRGLSRNEALGYFLDKEKNWKPAAEEDIEFMF